MTCQGGCSRPSQLNQHLGTFPYRPGNDVTFFDDYGASISAMTAEVERAERYVHVEFYIMAIDEVTEPFFAACREAVARGVTVRVLFDHLGSRAVDGYKDMLTYFEAAGFHLACDVARSSRSRAAGSGRTFATTARSWSSTDGSP